MAAEGLLSCKNLGNRRLGNRGLSVQLCLRDPFRFHEMAKHLGVRGGLDGVVFVLVSGDKIAESVKIYLRTLIECASSEKLVHDFLRFLKLLVRLDGGEREGDYQLQIGVP